MRYYAAFTESIYPDNFLRLICIYRTEGKNVFGKNQNIAHAREDGSPDTGSATREGKTIAVQGETADSGEMWGKKEGAREAQRLVAKRNKRFRRK